MSLRHAVACRYVSGLSRTPKALPLRPRGKEPLTSRGFHDATSDEVEIRRRWQRDFNANIGLPTGATNGIMVVDIDGEKGERQEGAQPLLRPLHLVVGENGILWAE